MIIQPDLSTEIDLFEFLMPLVYFIVGLFCLIPLVALFSLLWKRRKVKLDLMEKSNQVLSTANRVNQLLSSNFLKFGDRTKAILLGHVLAIAE